jgi:hypothetical protein
MATPTRNPIISVPASEPPTIGPRLDSAGACIFVPVMLRDGVVVGAKLAVAVKVVESIGLFSADDVLGELEYEALCVCNAVPVSPGLPFCSVLAGTGVCVGNLVGIMLIDWFP